MIDFADIYGWEYESMAISRSTATTNTNNNENFSRWITILWVWNRWGEHWAVVGHIVRTHIPIVGRLAEPMSERGEERCCDSDIISPNECRKVKHFEMRREERSIVWNVKDRERSLIYHMSIDFQEIWISWIFDYSLSLHFACSCSCRHSLTHTVGCLWTRIHLFRWMALQLFRN